ncbi:MAG: hydroxymethylbilane synthase [Bacteroidetes bacterium]|nr:hydroxymethylbilane synthase [Bacteroidota bacterium]
MKTKIIIGTRGSKLALWQANYTKNLLEKLGKEVEIKIISTVGDKTQEWNTSFDKIEGKGFFTKELEEALLNKEIDLAVHSHKDLPTSLPDGLIIAGVSKREDPRDILIIRKECVDENQKFNLKLQAKVGTSSSRRKSQLLAFRDDVELLDLRGNVPTRIEKLKEKQFDAILLAAAGIERLEIDLEDFYTEYLNPSEFVPAPSQGVLAWQTRENDDELISTIDKLNDFDVFVRINIERTILKLLEGGCLMPLGAFCETEEDDDRLRFKVHVSVAKNWNEQPLQYCFETTNTDGLAHNIVDRINAHQSKKIFITKNNNKNDYFFKALHKLGHAVTGNSLIDFKAIALKEIPKVDWIFFSSKHGVKYFLIQKPKLPENVKFACVGSSTSAELRKYGYRADFIGSSTDTKLIGKQFAAKVGAGKVLFPIAKDSMQSIQWQMTKKENVLNMFVYHTIENIVKIDDAYDVIVFTSPSNVTAFLKKNKIQANTKIVAMGDSTGKELERNKIKSYVKPQSFDDLGLVKAVLGAI